MRHFKLLKLPKSSRHTTMIPASTQRMSYILVSPILTSPHCTLLLCYLLLWWSAAALLRQAVACATAVAPYGGTALAAKSGISTIRSSATYPQGGLLAADRALLKHLLEPVAAA